MSNAIQIAFYLGFKEIFLLGFDLGNANQPRFYEHTEDVVRSGLLNDYEEHIKPFMLLTKLASKKQAWVSITALRLPCFHIQ